MIYLNNNNELVISLIQLKIKRLRFTNNYPIEFIRCILIFCKNFPFKDALNVLNHFSAFFHYAIFNFYINKELIN